MKNLKGNSILLLFTILCFLLSSEIKAQDCNCDIVFDAAEKTNPFLNGDNTQVNPGDTICIKGGTYTYIRIINIHGTAEQPIVIRNCDGQAKIDLTGQGNHGFVMNYSTHFRVTGTGDPDHFYGFEIFNDPQNASRTGMAIGRNISDVELDHVEAHHVELGLHLINVPQCEEETWAENWTMENASVHDWYVHNTVKEGLYIGSSKYGSGHTKTCNNETLTLQPPLIKGIRVYNNKFDTNGWDAFQVSVAIEDCEIYNNECRNFGLENKPAQRAGIVVGGGSTGLVYNNYIDTGEGDGIDVFGIGNVRIFNNVIIGAKGQGIFIGNREVLEDGFNHYVINNTIINSGEDNIRYNNQFAVGSKVMNNLSVNPGQKHINYVKEDNAGVEKMTNMEFADVGSVGFVDPGNDNYALMETSSAVNSGTDVSSLNLVDKDYNGNGRPAGGSYDVGAFEYTTNNTPVLENEIPDQSAEENIAFEYTFSENTFSDVDGDSFTYAATLADGSALPDWLSFNEGTRTFSGTPGNEAGGSTITIKVIANDGNGGTTETTFDIIIADGPNNTPVLSNEIADQTASVTEEFSFTIPENTFSDPDGDAFTFVVSLDDDSPLPDWLSFDSETRTFTGTPPEGSENTTISIKVVADDGNGGTVSDVFDITIIITNNNPVVDSQISDQSVSVEEEFSFTVPGNTFNDPDGDSFTLSATLEDDSPLPAWLTFDPSSATLSGIPPSDSEGTSISVKITADDGNGGTVSTVFVITITERILGLSANTVSNALTIYPNPARDQLHIDLNTESSVKDLNIIVISISGTLIKEVKYAKDLTINVIDLDPGMYFIKTNIDGVNVTKSFVKK